MYANEYDRDGDGQVMMLRERDGCWGTPLNR